MENIEYAINERNGEFRPGAWVTTMERDSLLSRKKPKRNFYTFAITGILFCNYNDIHIITPPPLPPFSTLSAAQAWLDERLNTKRIESIFHPYGNQTTKG